MVRPTSTIFATLALVAVFPLDVQAYCRTTSCRSCTLGADGCPSGGRPVAWGGPCVSFSPAKQASTTISLADVTAAADAAFTTWREAVCPQTSAHPDINVTNAFGPTVCNRHEYNSFEPNANIIAFREEEWPYDMTAVNALAITSVTFDTGTGEIYDADIEINGSQPISATEIVRADQYDLQSILTHEAGHFLGLAHSTDSQATMWPRYDPGSRRFRQITADDVAGICAIYPPGSNTSACNFSPRNGYSPECGMPVNTAGLCNVASGSKGGGAWWAALPIAVGIALARRRDRRAGADPKPRSPTRVTGSSCSRHEHSPLPLHAKCL